MENRARGKVSMVMTKFRVRIFAVGLLGVLCSPMAQALGLGQATVDSYHQQPLDVRIDLISRSEAEMATVTAALASPADFRAMGLTRNAISIPLEFTIERGLDDPHIRVTSLTPVNDPVLQLVVEVVWGSGRMLRQYTLFLDPPTFESPAPLPATRPARQQSDDREASPSQRVTTPAPQPIEEPQAADPVDESPLASIESGPPFAPAQTVPEPTSDGLAVELNEQPSVVEGEDSEITTQSDVAQAEVAPTPPEAAIESATEYEEALAESTTPIEDVVTDVEVASEDRTTTESAGQVNEREPESDSLSEESEDLERTELIADTESVDRNIQPSEVELVSGSEPDSAAVPESEMVEEVDEATDGETSSLPIAMEEPAELVQDAPAISEPDPLAVEQAPLDEAAEAEPLISGLEPDEGISEPTENETAEVAPQVADEPAPVTPPVSESPETQSRSSGVARAVLPSGPAGGDTIEVQQGDTLWSLSRDIARDNSVSVNQVMLAVQQKNPQAFINDNINALMAGQILRMPDFNEVSARTARDALLEVQRQEALYRTRWDVPVAPADIPVIADSAQIPDSAASGSEATTTNDPEERPAAPVSPEPEPLAASESLLELVPPSADDEGGGDAGQGTGADDAVSSGESVVGELARTQEELANARQENAYLEERIAELEAELARDEAVPESGVEDTTLAEMEDRLREERLADEPQPELDLGNDSTEHWLSGFTWLILGCFLLLVAGLIYYLRGRRDLEVLGEAQEEPEQETPETEDEAEALESGVGRSRPGNDQTVTNLDEDNPEDWLNMARAYQAMGREEEARALLDRVLDDGDASQIEEAREILREL